MIGILYRAADAIRRRGYRDNHGRIGEDMAHRYLRRRGCTVVARNYRTAAGTGEIDIVAWHGSTLVFVEVKTRATSEFGEPEAAVDTEKQRHIVRTAREYMRRADVGWENARFDILSVVLGKYPKITWLRDAFRPG